MPNTTRDSVAILTSIIIFTALIGAVYTGHLPFHMSDSDGGKVVSVHAQAPSQNSGDIEASMVLDSVGSIPAGLTESEPTPNSIPVIVTTPAPTKQIKLTGEQQAIKEDIKKVFGTHADKAFQLLSCENASLNPNVENHNNDNLQTTDYGVFQINDYWQGVRHQGKAEQFLKDPQINVRIAWRIYEDDGYSFKLWTCGRKLGL